MNQVEVREGSGGKGRRKRRSERTWWSGGKLKGWKIVRISCGGKEEGGRWSVHVEEDL